MRIEMSWTPLLLHLLPLLIVGVGVGLTLHLISLRRAFTLIGLLLPLLLLAPFAEALWRELPPWLALTLVTVLGLRLLQTVAGVVYGRRAADGLVASLAADLVRCVVRLLILPLRLVSRVVGAGLGRWG